VGNPVVRAEPCQPAKGSSPCPSAPKLNPEPYALNLGLWKVCEQLYCTGTVLYCAPPNVLLPPAAWLECGQKPG